MSNRGKTNSATDSQLKRSMYLLLGAWVIVFAFLLSIPDKYSISDEWEAPVIIASMFGSFLVVLGGHLRKLTTFWLALITGIAAVIIVVRSMHPENTRGSRRNLAYFGFLIGLIVWGFVFAGLQWFVKRRAKQSGHQRVLTK